MKTLSALSKKLCKRCCTENFRWDNSNFKWWTVKDEKRWKEGYVFCPYEYAKAYFDDDDIERPPPINCPYHLEHILETQMESVQ